MRTLSTKHALLAIGHLVVFAVITQTSGLIFSGLYKLLAIAAFGVLMSYVIGRTPNLLHLFVDVLREATTALLVSGDEVYWPRFASSTVLLPDEPLLAAHFQRPPPLLAL